MFPENDNNFEEAPISKVDGDREHGWCITKDSGWSIGVPKDAPFAPQIGMSVRLYGKGIGYAVRGMFINGAQVYYRTEAEDEKYRDVELYGADAREWLKRWDEGRSCWTIEMGGLGPGYEQCIHIVCAEVLRYWLSSDTKAEDFATDESCKATSERTRTWSFENEAIKKLGLSGAQYGAGVHVAKHLFVRGPIAIMKDPAVKDRRIQVSRTFP
jgi:hypothetical protein